MPLQPFQRRDCSWVQCIPTEKKVLADLPEIAYPANWNCGTVNRGHVVRFIALSIACLADENIDFGSVEACKRYVEVWFNRELLEFQSKKFSVPTAFSASLLSAMT